MNIELLNWKLLIVCFLLGGCLTAFIILLFIRDEYLKKIDLAKAIDFTLSWLSRLWYPLILIFSTTYVCINYPECFSFQFFSDFQGDNLIFLICVLLWLLPLFEKFEIFSANFKLRWQNEISKKAAREAIMTNGTNNAEQLEKMMARKEDKDHVE